MSVIEKLIRFHKFTLDEKRRLLKELQEQEARIEAAIARLDCEVRAEQAFARGQTDFAPYYGGYASRTKLRRDDLEIKLDQARGRVEAAREEVSQAFEELKKYEINKEARDEAAYRETERQTQIELDEIALTAHRRKDVG